MDSPTFEDPAAEFLAREQRTLGGLADDLQPEQPEQPALRDFGEIDAYGEIRPAIREEVDDFAVEDAPPEPAAVAPPSVPRVRVEREEPEKIRKWREEQQLRLERKDAEEEVRKKEMREVAKKELEEWYANHEEQIGKTKAANRSAEKQFVAESDEMEPGTEWERIAKLCDFNPKSAKSSKDVSRMRSIILQLKQTGLVTPKKA